MPRETIKRIHGAAAFIALMCIVTFWISTAISELFFSHSAVATVKRAMSLSPMRWTVMLPTYPRISILLSCSI